MSSTAATSLSDSLPSSIPKLDSTGLNWAIFSVRFQDAVEAKGFWGHFDGTTPRPANVAVTITAADGTTSVPIETTEADKWDKDKKSAKSLLTQKIPDSTLMRIHTKKSVKERWDAIVAEYTEKGAYAQTEMRTKFLESRYSSKITVREFLDNLRVEKEKLATVGVEIDEKDYRSTIISSLPYALANFASSQLAAARLYASTKTIAPDSLISLIVEESERQKVQRSRWQGNKSKGDDKDEALSVAGSSKSSKSKGKRKPKGTCWNCGEKGHYKDKCTKPAKTTTETKKEASSAKAGSANTAVQSDLESEGAFAMESDTESVLSESDEMPALESVTGSSCSVDGFNYENPVFEEGDWFSEIGDGNTQSDFLEDWNLEDNVIYLIFYFHFIFAKSCLLVTFNFFSASTPLRSASAPTLLIFC